MSVIWAFIRLSRPQFLVGGLLLFAVGAAGADSMTANRYFLAQVMVTAIQITAHYVNEYADVEADSRVVNRTLFSGGSGVLAGDLLDPSVALRAAKVTTIAALAAAFGVMSFSTAAGFIGLGAVGVAWAYSMPPVRLLASGFGELLATLVVAGAVPLVGSLAGGGSPGAVLWWSISILVPTHLAMMLSFELPDLVSDAATGKRVLGVRIGRTNTIRLLLILLAVAAVVTVAAGATGGLPVAAAWGVLGAAIPALVMVAALARSRYELLTAAAVATLVVVAAGLVVGLQV